MSDPLLAERAAAETQIAVLTREFDERQQVVALLDAARRRLAEVDAALARRAEGRYGVCESCGRPIAAERLAVRPAARTCIDCAR
jgi:DnaK suppressor protein